MARFHSEQEVAAAYRKAYESGRRAKRKGFERIPTVLGDCWTDWWFYAGWDGLDQDSVWERFREVNANGIN